MPKSYDKADSEAPELESLKGDDKTLQLALKRFRKSQDTSSSIRRSAIDDVSFLNGKQWPDDLERERNSKKRPCLKINRIFPMVNRVANSIRQNRPSIKIRATSDAYVGNAMVVDGLIRNILHNGDSKSALDTATLHQVSCGFGYIRVVSDYADDTSFDQVLSLARVENQFSVYVPLHLIHELDYSDMPYCFLRSKMSKDEYKTKYGKFASRNWSEGGIGDKDWDDGDSLYLAEYYCVYETPSKLFLFSDGTILTEKPKENLPDGITLLRERDVYKRAVKWHLMSQYDVLEEKDWPGRWIPVVPVLGQEFMDNGERVYVSLTRFAKDPQRLYNYIFTNYCEVIGQAPRAPWLVAEGQIEDYEEVWRTANTDNHAYLPYKTTSENGALIPPPQRIAPPNTGNSLFQGIQLTSEQLKETTNLYDASLGSQGNETSGKAILARQTQGDVTNFHFVDNLAKSVHHIGRILVDLIPSIYDTPRAIRILGPDMVDKVVKINAQSKDGKLYDLTAIENYEIVVDTGPDYETRRLENAQNLISIVQALPMVGQAVGDILLRQLDFPLSEDAANRIKRLIQTTMPGVIADNEGNPGGELTEDDLRAVIGDLQKVQQQLQMTQQQAQMMAQYIQQLEAQVKDREADRQIEMDKTVIKAQAGLQETQMQTQADVQKTVVQAAVAQQKLRTLSKSVQNINPSGASGE